MAGELLHRREWHALREIGNGLFFGPPRRFDPLAEIREVLVRGVKPEGADGVCCGLSWGVERRDGAGHCGILASSRGRNQGHPDRIATGQSRLAAAIRATGFPAGPLTA